MNTYDEAMFYGFLLGIIAATLIEAVLWFARDESNLLLRLPRDRDWPDVPLRRLTDDDLRIIRICDGCRCYMGGTRTINAGQHLNLLHDV